MFRPKNLPGRIRGIAEKRHPRPVTPDGTLSGFGVGCACVARSPASRYDGTVECRSFLQERQHEPYRKSLWHNDVFSNGDKP